MLVVVMNNAKCSFRYAWRSDDKNKNGLTWPEWFKKNYGYSYAVSASWSPVMTTHEKYFDLWKNDTLD